MIPYIHVSDIRLGSVSLHPFGLLVATGVIIGTWLATKRARQRGLDLDKLNSFITWMLIVGFMGGHMLDQIFYHPGELIRPRDHGPLQGWPGFFSLFMLWEGLSSFGGFVGALIGIVLWKYFEAIPIARTPFLTVSKYRRRDRPMPILPFADLILSVFPVAWIFGRSGCSVVHDHPGAHAAAGTLLAVAYGRYDPAQVSKLVGAFKLGNAIGFDGIELRHGNAPQFDLGTLELMFTIILAACFALTWRKKLTTGSYVVAVAFAYAPVRFAMDFLRVHDGESADPRYLFLTPAQWACVALFVFGLVMLRVVRGIKASGKDPQDMLLPPADADPPPAGAYRESA